MREFYTRPGWQGQEIFVRVGSANYAAKVSLNGHLLGVHQGGHLPIAFEIGNSVDWDGPNSLASQVEAQLTPTRVPPSSVVKGSLSGFIGNYPRASFDLCPFAGLQRPVALFAIPGVSIENVTVKTDIDGRDGIVTVTVVQSGDDGQGRVKLAGDAATAEVGLSVLASALQSPPT